MSGSDTIVAIATAWGEAGIAIVRLSGAGSVNLTKAMLKFETGLEFPPPRFMRLASLVDGEGAVIDQVLVVYFAAPWSYTGEDVVEIHTHGGTLVAQLCLENLLRKGARLAQPGEFTKRAFLNGRIDLSQSESVLGIIRSRSEEALRAAARTLSGELSVFAAEVREELLDLQGVLEVGLDFPEEATPYKTDEALMDSIATLRLSLEDLLDRCSVGLLLREGIRVALVGRPNVGKSSLLNALLKQSRAIVTALPGTTRDVIEEAITYRGVPIRLVDTAGLRAPADEAEAGGVERALEELRRADICLWVLDGSLPLDEDERDYIDRLREKDHLVVLNKSDLKQSGCLSIVTKESVTEESVTKESVTKESVTEEDIHELSPESPVLSLSTKTGEGLDLLKESILALVSGSGALDSGLNVTARQLSEIREALLAVTEAETAVAKEAGQDIIAGLLAAARECLERLLGLSYDDALLDNVFSRFCVGK
ncbi:MAG: tRNA uridine-5-carboxymethylaminomethyl(34) synthesis GTPase MnmE [Synergistaceae bacterium]|nr:tRNA uridine-5-carboxymethylaminomethyl(34) synthesis GTPase MnmE [Synergistaceae bacterium]